MIVVLEGPDGAGKTFLAEHLREKFGLAYHREGPPPVPRDRLALHYTGVLFNAVMDKMGGGKGTVLDRFALSQSIYGPVYRGEDDFAEELAYLGKTLRRIGALQVLCLPPLEMARACWSHRAGLGEEMIVREDQWLEVYRRYEAARDTQDFVHDWTCEDSLGRLEKVLKARGLAA